MTNEFKINAINIRISLLKSRAGGETVNARIIRKLERQKRALTIK